MTCIIHYIAKIFSKDGKQMWIACRKCRMTISLIESRKELYEITEEYYQEKKK